MTFTRRQSLSRIQVFQDHADMIYLDPSKSSPAASQSGDSLISPMEQHDGICQPQQLNRQNDTTAYVPNPDMVIPMEQDATDRTTSPNTIEATLKTSVENLPRRRILWSPGNRNIILLCMLVIIPITAFTATILRLIFGNKTDARQCVYQELCPNNGTMSGIDTQHNYYVDYPAARLAFVASWSSTVSFSLVGTMMAIYSYFAASKFMKLSATNVVQSSLPTTHQISILLRILNAELLTLYSVASQKLKDVFWKKKRSDGHSKQTKLLRFSILVFSAIVCASVFIQAADTYLHVTIEAVDMTQAQTQPSIGHSYGRGLAPWCLNRPTTGYTSNPNYWSCGLYAYNDAGPLVTLANSTEFEALSLGYSKVYTSLDYIDADGTFTAILAPKDVPTEIDYFASTFGVSMQCQPIRNNSCSITETDIGPGNIRPIANFNCSDAGLGVPLSGNIYDVTQQTYEFDLHRLLARPPPFDAVDRTWQATQDMLDAAANLSDADASNIFSNPWRSLSVPNVYYVDMFNQSWTDNRIYNVGSASLFTMNFCKTAVWNVNYTLVDSRVTIISKELSNNTVAGIASMAMADMFLFGVTSKSAVVSEVNYLATNMDEFMQFYTRGMSRAYLSPLGAQSSPRPALLVQSRNSRIVSQVPKAALWLLVTANLLYIILAISLTVLALLVTSMDVEQLQTRLNVTGLAAQLFEGAYAGRQVRDEKELFEASARVDGGVKRVGVQRTRTGGTTFEVVES